MESLSRREALKLGALGVSAVALAYVPFMSEIERFSRRMLSTPEEHPIEDNSVLIGLAPTKNSSGEAYKMIEKMQVVPGVVNYFISGPDETSIPAISGDIDWCLANGIVPMVSWGPRSNDMFSTDVQTYVTDLADMFAAKGPVLFRPYFESNLHGCFSWNEPNISSTTFKENWKQMFELVKEHAPETKVIFSPLTTGLYVNPIGNWFPGSEYIDLTGLDAYNKYSPNWTDIMHYVQPDVTPHDLIGPDILTLKNLAPNAPPPMITELNMYQEDRSTWLIDALTYCGKCGIRSVNFFQWNKKGAGLGETDWSFSAGTLEDLRRHFDEKPWYIRDHERGVSGARTVMKYLCAV